MTAPYPQLVWGDTTNLVSVCWQYACGVAQGYPDAAFDFKVYQALVDTLCIPAGVPVMNVLPWWVDPSRYVLVLVAPAATLGWRDAGGTAGLPVFWNRQKGDYNVATAGYSADPTRLAAAIAHEAVHKFELPDDAEPSHEPGKLPDGSPNLMDPFAPTGGRLSARRIARVKSAGARYLAGERFGPNLLPNGTWTEGWYKVKA